MVFSIVAKTGGQKSPFRDFSGTSAVIGNILVYTCPTGKIAKCMGSLVVNTYAGGATKIRMRGAAGAKVINLDSGTIAVGDVRNSELFVLEAGDTCTVTANLGVTSGADWTLAVEELPA